MTHYCGECREECDVHIEDDGIGPYEFWGAKSKQSIKVLRSDCHDADAFEDEDCTIEADAGQYEYDEDCARGDYEYDMRKDREMEDRYDA